MAKWTEVCKQCANLGFHGGWAIVFLPLNFTRWKYSSSQRSWLADPDPQFTIQ